MTVTEQTTLDVAQQPATGRTISPAVSAPPAPMSTRELNELLHAHFIKPEDRLSSAGAGAVYLTEVTAPGGTRRADAVHLGLWSSRGAGSIDVCELKTSKGDFRRELEQPAKAEAWWPYCSRFWIVSPGVEVTPPEELPEGWGLMVPKPRSRRFKVVVKPAERTPELTMGLLLTLLKNTETTRTNDLRFAVNREQQRHYEELDKVRRQFGNKADPGTAARLKHLDALEEAMGVQVGDFTSSWDVNLAAPEMAAALKEFMTGTRARVLARKAAEAQANALDRQAGDLSRAAKAMADQAAKLRESLQ